MTIIEGFNRIFTISSNADLNYFDSNQTIFESSGIALIYKESVSLLDHLNQTITECFGKKNHTDIEIRTRSDLSNNSTSQLYDSSQQDNNHLIIQNCYYDIKSSVIRLFMSYQNSYFIFPFE